MAQLTQKQFLKTMPAAIIPHLPPHLQAIKIRQPWRFIIQFHFGEPGLHYEISNASRQKCWEIGFHCESKDKQLNRYLLNGFRQNLFEIKDSIGNHIEAEMWDKGWTKIYELYPYAPLSIVYQEKLGQRVAEFITCIQPIFAELRGNVRQVYR